MSSQKQRLSRASSRSFLSLPREIQDQMYRELLLQDLVWDQQSGRFDIQTSILHVSKQINNEASRILYKENCWILVETNYFGRYMADFSGESMSMLRDNCQPLVSSKRLISFPRDPFLPVRVMKGCSMINHIYFLTTPEGLRGICKCFTSQDSRLTEMTLYFNIAGRLREQLLNPALVAFQEARGVGTASVFGIADFSKGHQLAKFMKTPIENLEELASQASVFESRGDYSMQTKDFRKALREYSLGKDYATWIRCYLADMKSSDRTTFIGDSVFDPMKESFFVHAKLLCLLACGQPEKALTTFLHFFEYRPLLASEAEKIFFYGGLIMLDEGCNVEAIHMFILSLHWRHKNDHQTASKVRSLEAQFNGNLNPQLNTAAYYKRLQELYKPGTVNHVGSQISFWTGHYDYTGLLSWHARHALREGASSSAL